MGVEFGKERFHISEVPVQVDLGEQQGQVLEVLPADRFAPVGIDGLGMADDVLVVTPEFVVRQARVLEQRPGELMVEQRDVVLVQPLALRPLHVGGDEAFETGDAEEPQHPLAQNQPLIEPEESLGA